MCRHIKNYVVTEYKNMLCIWNIELLSSGWVSRSEFQFTIKITKPTSPFWIKLVYFIMFQSLQEFGWMGDSGAIKPKVPRLLPSWVTKENSSWVEHQMSFRIQTSADWRIKDYFSHSHGQSIFITWTCNWQRISGTFSNEKGGEGSVSGGPGDRGSRFPWNWHLGILYWEKKHERRFHRGSWAGPGKSFVYASAYGLAALTPVACSLGCPLSAQHTEPGWHVSSVPLGPQSLYVGSFHLIVGSYSRNGILSPFSKSDKNPCCLLQDCQGSSPFHLNKYSFGGTGLPHLLINTP